MTTTNHALEHSWMIPRPGETLAGKYVVEGVCGRGGLAVVLSAMHVGLGQRVAIKLLLPEWSGDREVVQRFEREGRAATRIRSEHVIRVFDVGALDTGAPYLVLEYLEGHNLDDVVAMWGPLPVPTAIDWVLQAAEAIAEAHAHGIVHRDLKPANLFLTQRADGSACVKVLDFGLSKWTDPRLFGASAKLTRPSDVLGSPFYMAPEQLRATCNADARADLWAIGAVLHELLTAQTPFSGETMAELCATVLTQPPPRLSSLRANVAPEVETAILRCLEKDPDARFASVDELARALSPFGTDSARASSARIERVIQSGGRSSQLSLLPPMPDAQPMRDSWPSGAYAVRYETGTTAKVVLGSLLIFAGVGTGAFLWMYSSVHDRVSATATVEASSARPQVPTGTRIPPPPASTEATPPPAEPAPPPRTQKPPAPNRARRPPRTSPLRPSAADGPVLTTTPDDLFEGRK